MKAKWELQHILWTTWENTLMDDQDQLIQFDTEAEALEEMADVLDPADREFPESPDDWRVVQIS